MNRVVITGASGPLGIMLIKECIKHGVEVLAIIRPNSKKRIDIPNNPYVTIQECDISNIIDLKHTLKQKYDVFYHFAWTNTGDEGRNDPFLQADNIQNTLKAAKLAVEIGCKAFIGAGSQAEFGLHEHAINEQTSERPVTLYGITKLAAGRLVMEYCRQNGIRCNWVRIFTVFGPYENDYIFISYLIRTLLKNEKPLLTPCEQIWDFLYCEDAVRAFYCLGERGAENKTYCLGSGRADLLNNYVMKIRDIINPKLPLGIGEKKYGHNQIMHLEADISELKKDIGFEPAYSFEDGIQKTVSWYLEHSDV